MSSCIRLLACATGGAARRWFVRSWVGCLGIILLAIPALAQEIILPTPDAMHPIEVKADRIETWTEGQTKIAHLDGNIRIDQGPLGAAAEAAVMMIYSPVDGDESNVTRCTVYLEGQTQPVEVRLRRMEPESAEPGGGQSDRVLDQSWLGRLFTESGIRFSQRPMQRESDAPPDIYRRARSAMAREIDPMVLPAQFVQDGAPQYLVSPLTGKIEVVRPGATGADTGSVPDRLSFPSSPAMQNASGPIGMQSTNPSVQDTNESVLISPNLPLAGPAVGSGGGSRVQITARDSQVDLNLNVQTNPGNPNERIWIGTGGIRVTIDDPQLAQAGAFRDDQDTTIVILADNVVAWQTVMPDGEDRWEIYMEGDVVFSKDRRTIFSEQMYYDANSHRGTIFHADILTPVQQYQGLVRMKADVIQQVDQNNMQAYGAAITSSRIGVPRYWLQADSVELERERVPQTNDQGQALYDTATGQPMFEDEYWAEARRNRVYFGGIPIFAWPRFRTNLNNPSLYLERFRIGNDRVFGVQVMTGWDLYQVLGIRRPPRGSKWIGLLDYLSDRGLGVGSEFEYQKNGFLGFPGAVNGEYKSWVIRDSGLDLLGRGRANLVPEEKTRGRTVWRHRHELAPGTVFRGEFGWISDRNFLESFYEREWDTQKDATTGLWWERNFGTQSWNVIADYQLNEFFTQTSWLPRVDHFILGRPLMLDRAVWTGHSHIGYGRMRVATAPLDPKDLATFDPLAWEADVEGVRVGTRQQLEFPFQMGPVKWIPYVLGDATYWQQDLTGSDLTRAYGQIGMRASLPFWKVDPTIQSTLWNVNGLAHKVSFDLDAFYADASQDLTELPLYDPLDDDAQEAFRRRFAFNTFGILPGGDVPLRYDERNYAFRMNQQGWVTSPTPEIADDLTAIQFGLRQRWQTKRGMPGEERIIDWMTFNLRTTLFPNAARDNFGSDFGAFDYDYRWNIGDRFSFESDGYFDFFSQGLRTASFGVNLSRPEVGNVYVGFRTIEGPISSNVISANAVYRMSEKWGIKGLTQIDFGDTGTIGQGVNLVYIGESFLWQFGIHYDAGRDNLGFRFGFEPRFLTRSRLFNPGGVPVGPAGARWLE